MKKRLILASMLALTVLHSSDVDAKGSSSSGGSHSSGARSSSTSAAHSAAVNASRSATNAARMNSVSRMNSTSRMSRSVSAQKNAARSLVKPAARAKMFEGSGGRNRYYAASSGYQNNWLMYWMVINAHHNITVAKQRAALSKISDQPVYTITVEHDGQDRLYAVTPELYDKIQKGSRVKIVNGKVELQ